MLTDRPSLTAGTAAAEPLLFPSVSLSIILYWFPVCLSSLSLSFSLLCLAPSSPSHDLFLMCFYTIFLSFLHPTLYKQELHSQCLLLPMMLAMTASSVVNIMSLSLWFDKKNVMQYYTEFKQR